MKGNGVCYFCKQPGHMKHECPKWKNLGGAEGTTVSRGRVYTMEQRSCVYHEKLA
ncbi:hypothetical protein A2U01_0067925, partial [Trifolium medium]|nr:hypothetical protein [Trifolium medium]